MRSWVVAATLAVARSILAGAAWMALRPETVRSGIAVLGDEAPALHAAMGTAQTLPFHTAAVTVVSVQGWERLKYIPDMADLCGRACYGDPALVRVVPLVPGEARKILFLNLEAWPGTAGLTRASEEKDFSCVAQTLRAEFERLTAASPPGCAAEIQLAQGTRWVLPAGLGAL